MLELSVEDKSNAHQDWFTHRTQNESAKLVKGSVPSIYTSGFSVKESAIPSLHNFLSDFLDPCNLSNPLRPFAIPLRIEGCCRNAGPGDPQNIEPRIGEHVLHHRVLLHGFPQFLDLPRQRLKRIFPRRGRGGRSFMAAL